MGEVTTEVWRPSFVGGDMYDVSDQGRVRFRPTGRLLRPTENSHGYLVVSIHKKQWKVHRLVALTFLPETGPVVRHLDGDRSNNRLENLAFGDARANNRDTVRHGHNLNAAKTHCLRGHPFDDQNTYVTPVSRECRECRRAALRRAYARKKAAA